MKGQATQDIISVGGEGQPAQCKLTLDTFHISLAPEINAIILFSPGRTGVYRDVSLKSPRCRPGYAVDKPRIPPLDLTDRTIT